MTKMDTLKTNGIITLTTDFGLSDGYVGAMKGVILNIYPEANLIDISHNILPHNLIHGTIVISSSYSYFPQGTIHLFIVDPGVGSSRKPILIQTNSYYFIGPDNGVLEYLVRGKLFEKYTLKESNHKISRTFHGRDIFAPAAAILASQNNINIIAEKMIDNLVKLNFPEPRIDEMSISGEILYIDYFGNLITNIKIGKDINEIQRINSILIEDIEIKDFVQYYEQGENNKLFFLINSSDYIEIATKSGSAKNLLKTSIGEKVKILLK